jgi:hypothetical protein
MTAASGGSPIIAAASISFSRSGDGGFKLDHGSRMAAAKIRVETREDMIRNHSQLWENTGEMIREAKLHQKPLNRSCTFSYSISKQKSRRGIKRAQNIMQRSGKTPPHSHSIVPGGLLVMS